MSQLFLKTMTKDEIREDHMALETEEARIAEEKYYQVAEVEEVPTYE